MLASHVHEVLTVNDEQLFGGREKSREEGVNGVNVWNDP